MKPIGIFDSGIGGLTVARAISEALPGFPIVYFGDTAHLPYGEKSPALIQRYSSRITKELVAMGCGSIVVACNSASSNALETVRESAGPTVRVVDVVTPVVEWVAQHYAGGEIGVIGTRATIDSKWYQRLLEAQGFSVRSLATPLLASAIEEGFHGGRVSEALIQAYLGGGEFQKSKALILGCTHYPLIADQIAAQLPPAVALIDSASVVASALQKQLIKSSNSERITASRATQQFLVSDLTESFALGAKRFFGASVELEERKWSVLSD